jgi:hypothetical protein
VKLKVAEVIKSVMQEGELGGLRVVVDVDPY